MSVRKFHRYINFTRTSDFWRRYAPMAAGLIAVSIGSCADAQTLKTIYAFKSPAQARHDAAITFDPTGAVLYGEGYGDGANGYGTIFKLTPPTGSGTSWTRTDLVSLDKNNRNAVGGLTANKVAGSFFGVSQTGGPNVANDGLGNGTVFQLQTTGTPKVTTITAFDGYNGSDPVSAPTLDTSGILIGGAFASRYKFSLTATTGGLKSGSTSGYGMIYNLAPPISGTTWTRT